ncbi:MAG: aldo/keto reductase [Acidimicrobiales bacterium]
MSASLVNAEPRVLGSLGPVGPLAFGCWRFTTASVDDATALVATALDLGMNLVDTADVYGLDFGGEGFGANETLLGRVLAHDPTLRDRMVIATKGGIVPPVPYDSGSTALTAACEASLRRLGVDTIDLYQVHRPDLFTHPADVAATLTALRETGKVREVGVSNHTVAQYDALAGISTSHSSRCSRSSPRRARPSARRHLRPLHARRGRAVGVEPARRRPARERRRHPTRAARCSGGAGRS